MTEVDDIKSVLWMRPRVCMWVHEYLIRAGFQLKSWLLTNRVEVLVILLRIASVESPGLLSVDSKKNRYGVISP